MDETTPISGAPRRVLAGRYVLRGLLGQGGMADVELATDEVLDRDVAVKILHARYSDDPAFLERFKREARAAASLNHPNMVAVYDTGESEGRPFIVMEYVKGRSLRELLRREGVLPERATEITADAALALHYAHDRGLIHRDIKPANIMISDEGQVKVTDFGIARAVNAETVTQTAAVFGTAAYIAPEQAQGHDVDPRTDVYSLGVVLYEMLTGRQPFSADSAVALAYKHVSEDPVPPSRINSEVSPSLEAVVLRSMAKDPATRYQSAREMHDDLQRAAQGLAVAAPAFAATTQMIRREQTMVSPAPAAYTEFERDVYPEEEERGNRTVGMVLLALLVLVAFGVAAYFLAQALGEEPATIVAVPDVVGRDVTEAQRILVEAGFETQVERVEDADAEENTVIATEPEARQEAEEGSLVVLRVSEGPALVQVPEIVGMTESDAVDAIQEAGLRVGERTETRSDEVEQGSVVSSDPKSGTEIEEGRRVRFVVSAGPATVLIPDVRNAGVEDARQSLRNSCTTPPCLDVETQQVESDAPRGQVLGTDPEAGQRVEFGSRVTLLVSAGPPPPSPSPSPEPPPPSPTPSPSPSPTEDDVIP